MSNEPELGTDQLDPAAVFACALSLHEACLKSAEANPQLNLSESYNGMDEFMREVMRVANLFEAWACSQIVFEELNEVWPYFMEENFGHTCLEVMLPSGLAEFDDSDCLRLALRLRLPIRTDNKLRLPVDVRASNPIAGSEFREFLIQTVRDALNEGDVAPFTTDDDPFDEEFEAPYFALYGVGDDGLLEHVADRTTYAAALSLAQKLAPGVALPREPVCRGAGRTDAPAAGAAMTRRGYCIFIHTLCQGHVPSVYESKAGDPVCAPESICVFDTELEAQREIADFMMTRLQEFMDGERDFEDATTLEEYVITVTVHLDGTITDETGRRFGSQAE